MLKTLRSLSTHLPLAWELTKQEFRERYAGMNFGKLWLVISPLIIIFIYTVIFSDFMKMKLASSVAKGEYSYSIYLIPGILSWNFFNNVTTRLSGIFFEKAPLIKKIDIPPFLFYFTVVMTEGIVYLISMALGLVFLFVIGHGSLWLPFMMLPWMLLMAVFALGFGAFFSLLTPFFRDLKEMVPIVLQLWFWMTPIVYPKAMIEGKLPWLVRDNPVYLYIEPLQNLFLNGQSGGWTVFGVALVVAVFIVALAGWSYKKVIPLIKDIL